MDMPQDHMPTVGSTTTMDMQNMTTGKTGGHQNIIGDGMNMNSHQSVITTEHPTDIDFTAISFNCNGFKGSYGSVMDILGKCDCLFLSETWLKQDEAISVSNYLKREFLVLN